MNLDIPGSQVYGSIHDGIFDGKIIVSPDEVYYIEKISKFSLPFQNESQHSVIYSETDIETDSLHRKGKYLHQVHTSRPGS